MKPTKKQFQKVLATFDSILEKYPDAEVDMMESYVSSCDSPKCHAGWYAIAKGYNSNYLKGIELLSKDLGFIDRHSLRIYFKNNNNLWGNLHANEMFSNDRAFGIDTVLNLKFIRDYWQGVMERSHPDI